MAKPTEATGSVSDRLDAIEDQLSQIISALSALTTAQEGGPTSVIELTEKEIDGIGDALDRVERDLSERQRLYLLGILGAAAHHLEGVASSEGTVSENLRTIKVANAQNVKEVKLADAFHGLTTVEQGRLGSVLRPGGEVMDSVGVGVGVACVGVDWSKDLNKVDVGGWRTNPAFNPGLMANPVAGLPGGFGR